MKSRSYFIKKYPLTTLLTIAIWVLCLIPIPETPLDNVSMIDKWTHIAFYAILSLTVAFEYYHNHHALPFIKQLLWVWLLPSFMGGIIEIVQATCTNGTRSGDWMDFAADTLGSTIALLTCILLVAYHAKR